MPLYSLFLTCVNLRTDRAIQQRNRSVSGGNRLIQVLTLSACSNRAAGNDYPARAIHSLMGIGEDIIECAVEQVHVAKHGEVFRQSVFDSDFRTLELSAEESHGFVYDIGQAYIVTARLTRPGIVEEVVDSRSQPAGFVINGREHGLRHGIFTLMAAYQEF